jgi:hypothetical protein
MGQDFAEQFEREESERRRRKAETDAQEAEFQKEIAIDAAGSITFMRLKQLVQRGYRPRLDDHVDAIWLEHLSDFPHRNIILYPDGKLVSTRVQPNFRIERDEEARFRSFLLEVPRPSLWDRVRGPFWMTVFWVLLIGFSLWFGEMAKGVFRSLGWH